MTKNSCNTKLIAGAFIVLTVSVIAGIITMIIFYKTQIGSMNPTDRPPSVTTTEQPPPDRRLPKNLVPESYKVFLKTHFYHRIIEVVNVTTPNQTTVFNGNSTVNMKCVQSTSSIYLHSRRLEVSDPVVMNRDNPNEEIRSSVVYPGEADFLEIQLNVALEAGGNYSLFLNFKGQSLEYMDGLFLSMYSEGVPEYEGDMEPARFLAATNMEPTFARTAFPCFDEPEMKAVFNITIIHRSGTKALSNAVIASETNIIDDEWEYTVFDQTPRMSTTRSIRRQHHRKYPPVLREEVWNHYSLTKLDQIALPDLNPTAMENWGLVTYQQGALLFEEGVSSLLHKESIAMIIAHELAHQWFGNLVTMKWWNEVWLNEGFANYMAYFAVDAVEPSFKMKDVSVMSDLHTAFEEDALAASHPLTVPPGEIQTPHEILSLFDSITYSKGAMVLRMLADIVGQNVFDRGVNMYLSDFKYSNTDEKNLWDNIQKAVDDDNGVINEHFLFNDSSESSLWWHVPIRFVKMSSKSDFPLMWLDDKPVTKGDFITKNGDWILANVNCAGYYRVNYNPENWDALSSQMEQDQSRIPLMNRGQLIDDAFNLARAKLVDVTLALNLTRFLRNETELIPWMSAMTNLEYFVLMFDRSEVYGPMQTYLREQVRGLYNFYRNYTDHSQVPSDHSSQHSQILAVRVACHNGLPECVTMATEMFALWMKNDTNIIHPNLRSSIYCQAVASGGKAQWDFAWNKLQSSNDTSEMEQLRAALSCSRETWLLNRYLQYTLDPEKIRFMSVWNVINLIALNPSGQALAWNFIRANWEFLSRRGGHSLIAVVARRFSTEFELEELVRFVTDNDLAYMKEEQAVEQISVNIQWVKEHQEKILQWFEMETAS
ncbi:unnamed protein product [Pleuronectes platessa]|uniref:Aminopeptidase n=1 Tax=Pleuronectes platessa TaxID=8262 RepID=A0A9N7UTW3_PLEPL|nr:unnamed protein product [Pleuronectes platessa]